MSSISTSLTLSLLFSILIFIAIPFFLARYLQSDGLWFQVLDGFFRLILFVGYLAIISMFGEMKHIFRYHGAEHKTIYCYEAGERLTIPNVKKYSRFHPRCGTSFLFVVILLSIIIFSFVDGNIWIKFTARILLLPVIAGIAYEIIKLSNYFKNNPVAKILIAPGLWLQRITTKEPTEKQLEVGIKALKAVVG